MIAERRNNTLKIPKANHKLNRDNRMNTFQPTNLENLELAAKRHSRPTKNTPKPIKVLTK